MSRKLMNLALMYTAITAYASVYPFGSPSPNIGAYVAGYIEEKYIILGFDDYTGCIQCFTSKVYKTLGGIYNSYRFAKLKYLEVIKHQ